MQTVVFVLSAFLITACTKCDTSPRGVGQTLKSSTDNLVGESTDKLLAGVTFGNATGVRKDEAQLVATFPGMASLQNPTFKKTDVNKLIVTLYRDGYNRGQSGIFEINLQNNSIVPIVDEDNKNSRSAAGPVLSYDGREIVFSSNRAGTEGIFAVDVLRGTLRRLTNISETQYYSPSISFDSEWMLMSSQIDESTLSKPSSIFRSKFDDDVTPERIFSSTENVDDRFPIPSKTELSFVFQRRTRLAPQKPWQNSVIQISNFEGRGVRPLSVGDADSTHASFSPDGKWVLFASTMGGMPSHSLFFVDASGTKPPRRVTADPEHRDGASTFSPDSKWIYFESHSTSSVESKTDIYRIPSTLFQ